MDSLSTQKAKPRKMKVVVKKSRVQILLDLFYRVIEITVVMVTVAKLCYQLVITFDGSGLTSFLINRHLAFVFGNAIVIALVVKCGFFVNQEPEARRNNNDFYDEFVRERSRGERSLQIDLICREKQSQVESEAKHSTEENRGKQSTEENRAKQSTEENRSKQSKEDKRQSRVKQSTEDKREKKQKKTDNSSKQSSGEDKETKDITLKRQRQNIAQNQEIQRKSYERSQSENLQGIKKSSSAILKRSETERSADRFDSDDELRYKIESFIARQRRNQKDEEFCII